MECLAEMPRAPLADRRPRKRQRLGWDVGPEMHQVWPPDPVAPRPSPLADLSIWCGLLLLRRVVLCFWFIMSIWVVSVGEATIDLVEISHLLSLGWLV